jgi:DNA helicase-4
MYQRYCDALRAKNEIDFTDAIIQATQICKHNPGLATFDYILVDEFQDISKDRYEFLKSLRRQSPLTKLFCVGDDWQSIFRFSGSDMALFYDFAEYFGHTDECHIETTYRFGNPLIAKSSSFILENENQKKKTVKPVSRDKQTYIHVHQYDSEESQALTVVNLVSEVPNDQSILILGRYGFSYKSLIFNSKGLIHCSSNGSDKVILKIAGRECEFMTVHKAKGLEADVVILINCSSDIYGFPSNISDDPILNYLLSASDTFEFAEERRLFYVAITRARKNIHVMFDRKAPSIFISEFQNIPESDICPVCGIGQRIVRNQGVAKNGHPFKTYVCSNNDGCDYLETVFDNDVVLPNK